MRNIILLIILSIVFIVGCSPRYGLNLEPECPICFCEVCPTYEVCPICEVCKNVTCPKFDEKPLVDSSIYNWGENIDNEDETFFDLWVYNFGDVEAKNVKAICAILNSNTAVIYKSKETLLGNVASKSSEIKSVEIFNVKIGDEELVSPSCMITDCDNCIILKKEIPELNKFLEEDLR